MPPFSGSVLTKKKAELQEIASALSLPEIGTREDLLTRIKRYIDEHQAELEDDPRFSGLVSSRKRQRSVQPSAPPSSSGPSNARVVLMSSRTSIVPIKEADEDEEEERERTPVARDLNDVSVMIPSTSFATPFATRTAASSETLATPSSLPPPSPAKSILADALAAPEVQAVVEMERSAVRSVKNALVQTRALLSNATTLYILSALLDVTGLVITIHRDNIFPLPSIRELPIPSLVATSLALLHWSIPAVIIPALIGHLISFAQPRVPSDGTTGSLTFDPLTASIVRVASTLAYRIPHIRITTSGNAINVQHLLDAAPPVIVPGVIPEVHSLDVLTVQWRLFTSVLALAFATAEGLGRSGISVPKVGSKVASRKATPEGTPSPL